MMSVTRLYMLWGWGVGSKLATYKILVSEPMAAQSAPMAFAPSALMPLMLKFSFSTLLTVLARSASQRMMVPSSPSLFLSTKILVTEAQTAIAGANAAAPSGPNLLEPKLSCVQEQGNGRNEINKQSGWGAGKGV